MADIIPAHLAIKSMRDNGYKNAAYAIAELIDNSIQAGATDVQLICFERDVRGTQRVSSQIESIAVFDNGSGMDKETFVKALQFGNGTHLTKETQDGIGRFGMGLPSASISQAKKVEVYTWQDGVEHALYSYLDVDEIADGMLTEIPEPEHRALPEIYSYLNGLNLHVPSGTLVIWNKIDRCSWKSARPLIENSEFLIGRIYRYFIDDSSVKIRMFVYNLNRREIGLDKFAQKNDPLYLMKDTSCPYEKGAMFREYPDVDSYQMRVNIEWENETYPVEVKYSIVKEEVRKQPNAGATKFGKHAAKNLGISVIRAKRELFMDVNLVSHYEPRERWWGMEVSFPPALDEVFGVTNNKQSAVNFSEATRYFNDLETPSFTNLKEEWEAAGDLKYWLVDLVNRLFKQKQAMMSIIKCQKEGAMPSRQRHELSTTAEGVATNTTNIRREQGYEGRSDQQEQEMTPVQQENEVKAILEDLPEDVQQEVINNFFGENALKYQFVKADLDSSSFFSVQLKGGKIIIKLNVNHPAYDNLIEVLEEGQEGVSDKERLVNASNGLKLLLMAWARLEDEELARNREMLQDVRADWGKMAREFLRRDE